MKRSYPLPSVSMEILCKDSILSFDRFAGCNVPIKQMLSLTLFSH